jgi:ubiquinone/menaquinone biosynthesis C-methylase UbiE
MEVWKEKFNEELIWTANLRDTLYEKAEFALKNNVLEIGCGKGELLKELGVKYNLKLYGIDNSDSIIEFAKDNLRSNLIEAKLVNMDILNNKFESKFFDCIVCHYIFLWINDLDKALIEINRILKPNGSFLILGEPDYKGLVEFPNTNLRDGLCHTIKRLGADPEIGRKLIQHFYNRFNIIEQYCFSTPLTPILNKQRLYNDLEFYMRILNPKKVNFDLMRMSIESNKYFLFIPVFTFYLKKV